MTRMFAVEFYCSRYARMRAPESDAAGQLPNGARLGRKLVAQADASRREMISGVCLPMVVARSERPAESSVVCGSLRSREASIMLYCSHLSLWGRNRAGEGIGSRRANPSPLDSAHTE